MAGRDPIQMPCHVSILYKRWRGRSDSGNIVGGILDGLQGITYINDRQVIQISYSHASQDTYEVIVNEIAL